MAFELLYQELHSHQSILDESGANCRTECQYLSTKLRYSGAY